MPRPTTELRPSTTLGSRIHLQKRERQEWAGFRNLTCDYHALPPGVKYVIALQAADLPRHAARGVLKSHQHSGHCHRRSLLLALTLPYWQPYIVRQRTLAVARRRFDLRTGRECLVPRNSQVLGGRTQARVGSRLPARPRCRCAPVRVGRSGWSCPPDTPMIRTRGIEAGAWAAKPRHLCPGPQVCRPDPIHPRRPPGDVSNVSAAGAAPKQCQPQENVEYALIWHANCHKHAGRSVLRRRSRYANAVQPEDRPSTPAPPRRKAARIPAMSSRSST